MSNYIRTTKNPRSGKYEEAQWLDNHFGLHRYGVRFPNGHIYHEKDFDWEFKK